MKISISELDRPEIRNLDSTAGGEIIGGATEVAIFTESFAEGDIAITKSDANVYNFSFKNKLGEYNLSFGFGYSLAGSFTAF